METYEVLIEKKQAEIALVKKSMFKNKSLYKKMNKLECELENLLILEKEQREG